MMKTAKFMQGIMVIINLLVVERTTYGKCEGLAGILRQMSL